jgi:hypothetical protein
MKKSKGIPVVSLRARDGTMLETLFKRSEGKTSLISLQDGSTEEHDTVTVEGREYTPYSADNNLLTHRVVVLPSALGHFESEAALISEIQSFIHRYVDLSPAFEEVAAHYALLTWGYDVFNELPYLRVRGQYGSGKSRFLLTIGSICFKPIFASGASTISPIFRLIDQVGGTLVIDEADFSASDERAEIIKILNNGNARGFPVLRSEVTPQKEFNPRAFNIFGPKIVATRHAFDDAALESRCLTEVLGNRPIRSDIPISLPRSFEDEAEALRNKLLAYRFRCFSTEKEPLIHSIRGMAPRRAQILAPLLSIATAEVVRERLGRFAGQQAVGTDTKTEVERCVLSSVKTLMDESAPLTLAVITSRFQVDSAHQYGAKISHRWLGSVLRRLGVSPQKSNGVYVVPPSEYPQLRRLFDEHGLGDVRDNRDVGESPGDAEKLAGGSA